MKYITIIFLFLLPSISNANIRYGTNSIYNLDNRELISKNPTETLPQIQKLASSVALIFNKDDLIIEQGQDLIFANLLEDLPPVGHNICPTERFAQHHAYKNGCSGFLVGKDLLATAGHCFKSQFSCDNQLIAFGVDAESEIPRGFKVDDNNIYHCKEIVAQFHQKESKQDYAVIRLDREADREPLAIRIKGKISNKDQTLLIGHPLGLPLIYSPNAVINENSNRYYFKTRVNSFHGNSGSPIFNARTLLVEGILVRGEVDIKYDNSQKCQRYIKYTLADATKGEDVTRIKYILPFIE